MTGAGEDDREGVDRAFADLVAGYHLTADRPSASPGVESEPPADAPGTESWADGHPLFAFAEPPGGAEPKEPEEHFVPGPPAPLPWPPWPVLAGWIGMGFAALVVLAATFGVPLPRWVGWAAGLGFVGGFVLLVFRLPRHRAPDAGDGAVL